MFDGRTLQLHSLGHGIVELCFNRADESVNKFDQLTLGELRAATAKIRSDARVRGVLISSAKDAFIVGADIFEFGPWFRLPEAELTALVFRNSSIIGAVADLPVPSVAAINGIAFGGGLEMALAADYRVMSDKAQIGLPEVTLGIVPAYGGTVRLSRLAGVDIALDWVTSGTPQRAAAALAAGVVDATAAPDELRSTALARLQQAIDGEAGWRERRKRHAGPVAVDPAKLAAARSVAQRSARHAPAALAAVELIAEAAGHGRDDALRLESETFAKLARTPIAAALVGLFLCDQALRKKSRQLARTARPITQAAVLGAGIMGGGIAYQTAVRGIPVIMKDIAQSALDLGMAEAGKLLDKQVAGGRMEEQKARQVLASIRPALDYSGIDAAQVVIEAVVENFDVKQKVLRGVEAQLQQDAIIATNTSSFSIAELSKALRRPEHLVGLHFFNPVPIMPLVEVIHGDNTSREAIATAVAYVQAIGKTPVVVADCPGFLVNRILITNFLGFLGLIRDGAGFEQVDAVIEDFGWPMGPAYLQDVLGMDTSQHVLETIIAGYPDRMVKDYKDALTLMVEKKRFGQKNGIGFYRYETDPKGRPRKLPAGDTHALLRDIQPDGPREFSETEIIERMMLPMIVDAAHCLEEGVVDTAGEIDLCMILGVGFPRYLGGILQYADQLGLAAVVAACERYSELGPLYTPTPRMREMAASSEKYFPD